MPIREHDVVEGRKQLAFHKTRMQGRSIGVKVLQDMAVQAAFHDQDGRSDAHYPTQSLLSRSAKSNHEQIA
jgi:hypothetical protein